MDVSRSFLSQMAEADASNDNELLSKLNQEAFQYYGDMINEMQKYIYLDDMPFFLVCIKKMIALWENNMTKQQLGILQELEKSVSMICVRPIMPEDTENE